MNKGFVTGYFYVLEIKKRYQRKLRYEILPSESNIESLKGKLVFYLIGGSTGYESFYLEDAIEDFFNTNNSWVACSGTIGAWHRLIIRNKDMRKALLPYWRIKE